MRVNHNKMSLARKRSLLSRQKDAFGEKLEEAAKADGVNVAYMKHEETPTGTCAVLVKVSRPPPPSRLRYLSAGLHPQRWPRVPSWLNPLFENSTPPTPFVLF